MQLKIYKQKDQSSYRRNLQGLKSICVGKKKKITPEPCIRLVSPHRRHVEAVITNFCKDLQWLFYGGASQLWTGKGWIN